MTNTDQQEHEVLRVGDKFVVTTTKAKPTPGPTKHEKFLEGVSTLRSILAPIAYTKDGEAIFGITDPDYRLQLEDIQMQLIAKYYGVKR